MSPKHLKSLQSWVYNTITNSKNSHLNPKEWNITNCIAPSKTLSSFERIHIYRDSYFIRLYDCLKHEYPILHKTIGKELFNHFIRNYLKKHPSTSYTLNNLGKKFPSFLQKSLQENLKEKTPDIWQLFIIDIAIYERMYNTVFNTKGHETLQTNAFFTNLKVKPSPSIQLLKLNFPIGDYTNKEGKQLFSPPNIKQPTFYIFTRQNYKVYAHKVTLSAFETIQDWINKPNKPCPTFYQNDWLIKGICYQ